MTNTLPGSGRVHDPAVGAKAQADDRTGVSQRQSGRRVRVDDAHLQRGAAPASAVCLDNDADLGLHASVDMAGDSLIVMLVVLVFGGSKPTESEGRRRLTILSGVVMLASGLMTLLRYERLSWGCDDTAFATRSERPPTRSIRR